ncbi:MAG: rod shape-determining protein MreD [Eubacteriales bacterium]|nr:rod shape-determining protein MreD [Eubacteriales bacterium]MDD3350374.1 rod shape-determining protein MreD [Eubacteriales bacterium]
MKYRFAIPLFLSAFLIQSTLINYFTFFGKAPNLLLCLVILLPFFYEGYQGLVIGVVFGLIQDICFSVLIGPTAIGFLLVGILMKVIRQRLEWDSIISVLSVAVLGTCVYYLVSWRIIAVFIDIYPLFYMLKGLFFVVVYNFFSMLLFYLVIGKRAVKHPQDKGMTGSLIHYY